MEEKGAEADEDVQKQHYRELKPACSKCGDDSGATFFRFFNNAATCVTLQPRYKCRACGRYFSLRGLPLGNRKGRAKRPPKSGRRSGGDGADGGGGNACAARPRGRPRDSRPGPAAEPAPATRARRPRKPKADDAGGITRNGPRAAAITSSSSPPPPPPPLLPPHSTEPDPGPRAPAAAMPTPSQTRRSTAAAQKKPRKPRARANSPHSAGKGSKPAAAPLEPSITSPTPAPRNLLATTIPTSDQSAPLPGHHSPATSSAVLHTSPPFIAALDPNLDFPYPIAYSAGNLNCLDCIPYPFAYTSGTSSLNMPTHVNHALANPNFDSPTMMNPNYSVSTSDSAANPNLPRNPHFSIVLDQQYPLDTLPIAASPNLSFCELEGTGTIPDQSSDFAALNPNFNLISTGVGQIPKPDSISLALDKWSEFVGSKPDIDLLVLQDFPLNPTCSVLATVDHNSNPNSIEPAPSQDCLSPNLNPIQVCDNSNFNSNSTNVNPSASPNIFNFSTIIDQELNPSNFNLSDLDDHNLDPNINIFDLEYHSPELNFDIAPFDNQILTTSFDALPNFTLDGECNPNLDPNHNFLRIPSPYYEMASWLSDDLICINEKEHGSLGTDVLNHGTTNAADPTFLFTENGQHSRASEANSGSNEDMNQNLRNQSETKNENELKNGNQQQCMLRDLQYEDSDHHERNEAHGSYTLNQAAICGGSGYNQLIIDDHEPLRYIEKDNYGDTLYDYPTVSTML